MEGFLWYDISHSFEASSYQAGGTGISSILLQRLVTMSKDLRPCNTRELRCRRHGRRNRVNSYAWTSLDRHRVFFFVSYAYATPHMCTCMQSCTVSHMLTTSISSTEAAKPHLIPLSSEDARKDFKVL